MTTTNKDLKIESDMDLYVIDSLRNNIETFRLKLSNALGIEVLVQPSPIFQGYFFIIDKEEDTYNFFLPYGVKNKNEIIEQIKNIVMGL